MVTVNTEAAKVVVSKAIVNLKSKVDYYDQLHYDEVKNSTWVFSWFVVPIKHWFKPKRDEDIRFLMKEDVWNKHHWSKHNYMFNVNEAKKLLKRIDNHEAMTYDLSNAEFNLYEWGLE